MIAILMLSLAPAFAQETEVSTQRFDQGVEAYRRGDYRDAALQWSVQLEEPGLTDAARARLCYDLGNAAWRLDEKLEAVAWYTACLRLEPRHADAWHNLEFVRREAGLEPADRGDLRSTAKRLVTSVRPEESRTAIFYGLGLCALLLAGEALRGGAGFRRGALVAGLLTVLVGVPWVADRFAPEGTPLMVVRGPELGLRTEPLAGQDAVADVRAGEVVHQVDQLPGWVRVRTSSGQRGWVSEDAVFLLAR